MERNIRIMLALNPASWHHSFFLHHFWDQNYFQSLMYLQIKHHDTFDTVDDCAVILFTAKPKPNHLHVPSVIRNKCAGVFSVSVFIEWLVISMFTSEWKLLLTFNCQKIKGKELKVYFKGTLSKSFTVLIKWSTNKYTSNNMYGQLQSAWKDMVQTI